MKSVLVIGAGMVARPLVHYLLDHDIHVTVADIALPQAQSIIEGYKNGVAVTLDVSDRIKLKKMIAEVDLAVSLLPAEYHVKVAEVCIETGTNMVTASYVSDEMRSLDASAKSAGVVLLNEIGVDPGLDHMSAMRVIDAVRAENGEITSFKSFCGGLPSPDDNDNPWGYKISWSPRSMLLAGKNAAHYRKDGEQIYVPAESLFSHFWNLDVPPIGTLEAYPNRDSLTYKDIYGLEGIPTMFRCTLRYDGWCRTLETAAKLGILNEEVVDWTGKSLSDLTCSLLPGDVNKDDLRIQLAEFLSIPKTSDIINRYEWLGLLSDEAVPISKGSILDVMSELMSKRMAYSENEKDMIVLVHQFEARYPDNRIREITSTLIDYGIPGGDSSMSRTVGLPAGVGARLVLDGKFKLPGVHIPVLPELYNPILDELAELGIECKEKWD
ncbi:MAG: saccharopine dehydrogenase C-terminal domain-containing protein [Candidatus Electryonea clarkiae]|nr:saccharopine dehydrogenase C-terminal domain-containing protein [Candidatus Electryonea clarkiae]MDP8285527.1 saccharopine dehydrogenase C-terminal domain-containing protein [Candidatus Electryonea clarkiae]